VIMEQGCERIPAAAKEAGARRPGPWNLSKEETLAEKTINTRLQELPPGVLYSRKGNFTSAEKGPVTAQKNYSAKFTGNQR